MIVLESGRISHIGLRLYKRRDVVVWGGGGSLGERRRRSRGSRGAILNASADAGVQALTGFDPDLILLLTHFLHQSSWRPDK